MTQQQLLVLPNRKCGRVRPGLYLVGRGSPGGHLRRFTAIAAPFFAITPSPQAPFQIDVPTTLKRAEYLRTDGTEEFGQLPRVGIADLWGASAGYTNVWDVIAETRQYGITRRVAWIPDIPRPFPVLMLHVKAYYNHAIGAGRAALHLEDLFGKSKNTNWTLDFMPWHVAGMPPNPYKLGTVNCPDFMEHPHVDLWRQEASSDPHVRGELVHFKNLCGTELKQGVFGLSWVTDAVQVLRQGQDPSEVRTGCLPAVGEDDPRAADGQQIW